LSADTSLLSLITGASLPVQLVMLLLMIASVLSWALILVKWRLLRDARREVETFEGRFWSGINLNELFSQLTARKRERSGMEAIFEAGFREFARSRKAGLGGEGTLANASRSMRVALTRESDFLETNLSFLATVGSTSPYVGLFGTVWGIMNAFISLGAAQQATLQAVAPGIAEALIATAIGLFAAIPAVIAYNRYSNDIDRLVIRYENFAEEFTGILQRQAHVAEPAAA
jgi:biopolymer transport protein TolQ